MIVIGTLNASTKYYVRVLASTKVGPGNYSENNGKFTNGGKFLFTVRSHPSFSTLYILDVQIPYLTRSTKIHSSTLLILSDLS